MNTHVHDFKMEHRGDCVYLTGLYDIHAGTKACDYERLQQQINEIKQQPNHFAFLGGDMCDFINPKDKRFDSATIAETHLKHLDNLAVSQADEVVDMLMPIKDRLIFTLTGNHEEKIRSQFHQDITNHIACRLGIPDLGLIGVVRLTFSRSSGDSHRVSRSLTLFAAHGFGSAQKYGGKINRIIDLMQWFDADIYWAGHVHAKGYAESPQMTLSRQDIPYIKQRNRVAILGGSYLRIYMPGINSYGEKVAYMPTPLGSVTAKITPFPGKTSGMERDIEKPVELQIATTIQMSSYDVNTQLDINDEKD